MQGSSRVAPPFLYVLLGGVCFFVNNHMLTIVIPLYLDSLGASVSLIGYASAAMGAVVLLFRFLCPPLFRRLPIAGIVFFSHLLLCLITYGLIRASSPLQVFFIRAAYGIPLALFPLNYLMLIRRMAQTPQQLTGYTSLAGIAMPLSMAVSPFVAELLSSRFSFTATYLLALGISILSLTFMSLGVKSVSTGEKQLEAAANTPLPQTPTSPSRPPLGPSLLIPIICYVYLGIVDMVVLSFCLSTR